MAFTAFFVVYVSLGTSRARKDDTILWKRPSSSFLLYYDALRGLLALCVRTVLPSSSSIQAIARTHIFLLKLRTAKRRESTAHTMLCLPPALPPFDLTLSALILSLFAFCCRYMYCACMQVSFRGGGREANDRPCYGGSIQIKEGPSLFFLLWYQ